MNLIMLSANAGAVAGATLGPSCFVVVILFVAIWEMQYKDYLFGCKMLRLDPTKTYEQSVVDQRMDALTEVDEKDKKKLDWFKKNYLKMEGGFFGNRFLTRATKSKAKGKLVIDYEIEE